MKLDNLTKKIEECKDTFVKYDTRIGRQIADYIEIRNQMRQIERAAEYYTRKVDEFQQKFMINVDPNNEIDSEDIYPITGMMYFIVMSYGRCFDTAKTTQGKESRRSVKLQKGFLGKADQSILDSHDLLDKLRNEYIAHAGANKLEKHELGIGLDVDLTPVLKELDANGSHQLMATDEVRIERIKPLLDLVIERVDAKIDELEVKAAEELNKISNDRVLFLGRLSNEQSITQQDLEKAKPS